MRIKLCWHKHWKDAFSIVLNTALANVRIQNLGDQWPFVTVSKVTILIDMLVDKKLSLFLASLVPDTKVLFFIIP